MHLLVTDRLACPHCGPRFGLVLVADRLENRRVLEGFFGCANCQARYPVRSGFGDLRVAPGTIQGMGKSGPAEATPRGEAATGEAGTLAALLGLTAGSGFLLITGRSVRHASELSRMGEGFEILAAHLELAHSAEQEGVSRMAMGDQFPFRSASLRGVVLEGRSGLDALPEGVRVMTPGSRLVLVDPPAGGREGMEEAGLRVLAGDETALVGTLK
jgi:hypothetical protein